MNSRHSSRSRGLIIISTTLCFLLSIYIAVSSLLHLFLKAQPFNSGDATPPRDVHLRESMFGWRGISVSIILVCYPLLSICLSGKRLIGVHVNPVTYCVWAWNCCPSFSSRAGSSKCHFALCWALLLACLPMFHAELTAPLHYCAGVSGRIAGFWVAQADMRLWSSHYKVRQNTSPL